MNEKIKKILAKAWNEPRHFFFWLSLSSLLPLGVAVLIAQRISETPVIQLVAAVSVLCFVLSLVAFVLSWIPPMRRLLTWMLQRRFFILACFVTLIALFYAVENWRGKRAWDKHRLEYEAKGEKFTIAALAPPPVPDEKNFALTPLLKPTLDFTYGASGVVWHDTNGIKRLEGVRAELPPKPKGTNQLVLGHQDKGTLANLEACRDFYRDNTNYPQPAVSGTAAADILVALGKFDLEIAELHEAAATRPYSRFPIEYNYEPSIAILLPHLAHMKGLTVLIQLRAIARLELGQSSDALAELKLGFRLSDSIKDEPILIDHLVRIATMAINLQMVREGLARRAWSDAQLSELEHYLASINLLAEHKTAMRGERAFSTATLDYMRRQRFHIQPTDFTDETTPGQETFSAIPGGWFYQNMLTISQIHQGFLLTTVDEKSHRVFLENTEKLRRETSRLSRQRYHPYKVFATLLFPALSKAVQKTARVQVYVDATRIACAVERYRLANGKLPETLGDITPQFISSIPNDVIDGKPLRYHKKADGGFVVYSIGWNETDDGGVLAWMNAKEENVDITKGDWVWLVPGK